VHKIKIMGGNPLRGQISISGAKNAALPLMCASLLTGDTLTLENVPQLNDIFTLSDLLHHMGVLISKPSAIDPHTLDFNASTIHDSIAPYELVRKMRASVLVLGPLVARTGFAQVSLPGGCAIGTRPIDLHIKGLQQMGADIELADGYVSARAPKGLKGTTFSFPVISVTGTENLMMAACLAKGTTRLINAALEPEVVDLGHCLMAMGAKISGLGTSTIEIEGVDALHGARHRILPDRIEMGTYMMASGITRGDIEILGGNLSLIPTVVDAMTQMGMVITDTTHGFRVKGPERLQALDVTTEPFPGFATDLQAQFMALMTLADGTSIIRETIFENRFMHVPELKRMGADITVIGNAAIVRGKKALKGAPVMATDLRASVSLVLAALAAEGETNISRVYHLDRGYEKVETKLKACGASIERQEGDNSDQPEYAA
jgi:UDP-N-acetylglucosamine 1-carboxyvinyltransferase